MNTPSAQVTFYSLEDNDLFFMGLVEHRGAYYNSYNISTTSRLPNAGQIVFVDNTEYGASDYFLDGMSLFLRVTKEQQLTTVTALNFLEVIAQHSISVSQFEAAVYARVGNVETTAKLSKFESKQLALMCVVEALIPLVPVKRDPFGKYVDKAFIVENFCG